MRIIKQDLEVYVHIDKTWIIRWFKNHTFHREDGPASIWSRTSLWSYGQEYYFLEGRNIHKNDYWKKVHANY